MSTKPPVSRRDGAWHPDDSEDWDLLIIEYAEDNADTLRSADLDESASPKSKHQRGWEPKLPAPGQPAADGEVGEFVMRRSEHDALSAIFGIGSHEARSRQLVEILRVSTPTPGMLKALALMVEQNVFSPRKAVADPDSPEHLKKARRKFKAEPDGPEKDEKIAQEVETTRWRGLVGPKAAARRASNYPMSKTEEARWARLIAYDPEMLAFDVFLLAAALVSQFPGRGWQEKTLMAESQRLAARKHSIEPEDVAAAMGRPGDYFKPYLLELRIRRAVIVD